jgi:hypothetical protein
MKMPCRCTGSMLFTMIFTGPVFSPESDPKSGLRKMDRRISNWLAGNVTDQYQTVVQSNLNHSGSFAAGGVDRSYENTNIPPR